MKGMAEAKGVPENEIVVFLISKPAMCAECGTEIDKGGMLRTEGEKGLCLECADLDHLSFLPRGDVALTRRSRKYSTLAAVVLEWNKRRKRYERQGLLVEAAAIERAEEECSGDAEARALAREKAAVVRERQDREYISQFTTYLLERYPKCPPAEAQVIAGHACEKYSGRVGRSASAKEFDPKKITLAVRAHIRHVHTNYDELLAAGVERYAARDRIESRLDAVERSWK
jgi:hypothetical protein